MSNGCIIVLVNSVRMIRKDLESAKDTMDERVYEKSMGELSSMESFLQRMMTEGDRPRV